MEGSWVAPRVSCPATVCLVQLYCWAMHPLVAAPAPAHLLAAGLRLTWRPCSATPPHTVTSRRTRRSLRPGWQGALGVGPSWQQSATWLLGMLHLVSSSVLHVLICCLERLCAQAERNFSFFALNRALVLEHCRSFAHFSSHLHLLPLALPSCQLRPSRPQAGHRPADCREHVHGRAAGAALCRGIRAVQLCRVP